jgi:hypothetical protein
MLNSPHSNVWNTNIKLLLKHPVLRIGTLYAHMLLLEAWRNVISIWNKKKIVVILCCLCRKHFIYINTCILWLGDLGYFWRQHIRLYEHTYLRIRVLYCSWIKADGFCMNENVQIILALCWSYRKLFAYVRKIIVFIFIVIFLRLWPWHFNITITILDIIHRLSFI